MQTINYSLQYKFIISINYTKTGIQKAEFLPEGNWSERFEIK